MNLSEMLCRYHLLYCSHNASQQALLQQRQTTIPPLACVAPHGHEGYSFFESRL
jgi:hypothetical protein